MEQKQQQRTKQSGKLTKKIVYLQDAIRRKYRNFKRGIIESENDLKKQYKPLIDEIKNTSNKEMLFNVKKEEKGEEEEEEEFADKTVKKDFDEQSYFKPQTYSSPLASTSSSVAPVTSNETIYGNEDDDDDDESDAKQDVSHIVSTPEGLASASRYINEHFTNPLTRVYMLKLMRDTSGGKQKIDNKFGPRYENDTLMVGNKKLEFSNDGSISLGGVTYRPTEGLYELLFKRIPDDKIYNDDDLKAYRDLLLKTSAHKKGYKYNGNINRDGSLKYKHVISSLFPKSLYSGRGRVKSAQMKATKTLSNDIVYWNDPNELCDRLRLLVASAETGNNSHKNEIISIVEELKEAKIILGRGNDKFTSLIQ